jgi:hypothetical protein
MVEGAAKLLRKPFRTAALLAVDELLSVDLQLGAEVPHDSLDATATFHSAMKDSDTGEL